MVPVNLAVSVWAPTANVLNNRVAFPKLFTAAVPRTVDPFKKVTLPAGAVVPVPFTVAIKVIAAPLVVDVGEATRVVVVGCAVTATDARGELLAEKFAAPPYTAFNA